MKRRNKEWRPAGKRERKLGDAIGGRAQCQLCLLAMCRPGIERQREEAGRSWLATQYCLARLGVVPSAALACLPAPPTSYAVKAPISA